MTIKGKDLIERISDKEYSEELIKELEKYEVRKPKSVWELENDDEVWMVIYDDVKGEHVSVKTQWFPGESDKYRREIGRVHLTGERAELHARVLNTELAIKKFKRENDHVELDWENGDQRKYIVYYDHFSNQLNIEYNYNYKTANTIYMSSEKLWEQRIEEIGEDRIIEWLTWEDNDQ